jgi:Fic family protein
MPYLKPPYQLTSKIFEISLQIQQILGELKSIEISKPSLKLRRENKIKTVHHSLAIEGNSLTIEQITAILENKRVIGKKNEIIELQNALSVYDDLLKYNPTKENDLKKAHSILMKNLVAKTGDYRNKNVGILKGTKVSHVAPQPKMLAALMKNLFSYLNNEGEKSFLIKACVFHYELEFIHPFEDGNGRIGRLWQQLLLIKHSPIFEFVSVESLIHKNQKKYYDVLEKCDRSADSTLFIEFSLGLILQALKEFQKQYRPDRILSSDRISQAAVFFKNKEFSRQEYLKLFTEISTATASRDLAEAAQKKIFNISGDKRSAKYKVR